jgi:hypothetical protein
MRGLRQIQIEDVKATIAHMVDGQSENLDIVTPPCPDCISCLTAMQDFGVTADGNYKVDFKCANCGLKFQVEFDRNNLEPVNWSMGCGARVARLLRKFKRVYSNLEE